MELGHNDEGPVCHECEAQGSTQYLPCPAHPHSPLEESLRLEAAYKSAQALDAAYAESDLFHHKKRVEFYARSIMKLAEDLIADRPATAEEAIEWSAEVIAHTRALCGEWTSAHRGGNIAAAWDLSAEVYADLLDGEEFDQVK